MTFSNRLKMYAVAIACSALLSCMAPAHASYSTPQVEYDSE